MTYKIYYIPTSGPIGPRYFDASRRFALCFRIGNYGIILDITMNSELNMQVDISSVDESVID